jgi:hypothetical protein
MGHRDPGSKEGIGTGFLSKKMALTMLAIPLESMFLDPWESFG